MDRKDKIRYIKRWANRELRAALISFNGMTPVKNGYVPVDEEVKRLEKLGYGKIVILEFDDEEGKD